MGTPAEGWMKAVTGRRRWNESPGAPSHQRETQRKFWRVIAAGVTSEGRKQSALGSLRQSDAGGSGMGGGMPPISLAEPSVRFLRFAEREEVAMLRAQHLGVREIARRLSRSPSTISRELRRNAATRCGKLEYRASVAQWKAELVAQRPKTSKLVANPLLRGYVQDRLAGSISRGDGTPVAGPREAPWRGRNKPHRGDRRWAALGAPSRYLSACRSTSPMMNRCGLAMRRSIRLSTYKAVAR